MISHQTRSGVDASLCFALENLFAQPAVFCTVRKMEMKLLCYVCARKRICNSVPKGQLISKCLFGIFNSPKKGTKKFDFTTI